MSKELDISLDYLVGNGKYTDAPQKENTPASGRITIKTYDGKTAVSCYKVVSQRISIGTEVPNYVLFGIDRSSFLSLDENRNTLGYYADKESVTKEINEIMIALNNGSPTYELKYCTKVKETFFTIKLEK